MGCGDAEVAPEEGADAPSEASLDESSLFTTIYCKLTSMDGNTSTDTTYFKYDKTTVHFPSDEQIQNSPNHGRHFNREHWKKYIGPYRLIEASIELPTAAAKSVFRPNPSNMYYRHGSSWHFVDPFYAPFEGDDMRWSTYEGGQFVFGDLIGPVTHAGALDFIRGNQYGSEQGTSAIGSWRYNDEFGNIEYCGTKHRKN